MLLIIFILNFFCLFYTGFFSRLFHTEFPEDDK